MKKLHVFAALCAGLCAIVMSGAATASSTGASGSGCGARAGWVSKIEGRASDVIVRRQGATLDASALMPICENDIVEVHAPSVAHLRMTGRSEVVVSGTTAAYQVPQNPRAGGFIANALDIFLDQIFPDLQRSTQDARLRGASVQAPEDATGPLAFLSPGLSGGDARLSTRDHLQGLTLRWSGGVAPFDVSVIDPNGVQQYRNIGGENRLRDAPQIALRPGRWQVRVADAQGHQINGVFAVVDDPSPQPTGWTSDLDESARVLWLARCEGDQWGFSALQLAAARRGTLPSGVMYDLLAKYAKEPAASDVCAGPRNG